MKQKMSSLDLNSISKTHSSSADPVDTSAVLSIDIFVERNTFPDTGPLHNSQVSFSRRGPNLHCFCKENHLLTMSTVY